jgi:GNAT superfamily N-acetyltransferase
MPRARINLRLADTADNDPFFSHVVREFYGSTFRRWRKLPLLKELRHGVALCTLPFRFDDYFMEIEASARRNYKKAIRSGYEFGRIDYNAHLEDVAQIWRSTDRRQGVMPSFYLQESPQAHSNPTSLSSTHDYPYFGVLKDGRLVAYASALVSGDAFMIQQIFGHAAHHANGVVPMLVIGMGQAIYREYPQVRFYAYGMYFGAGESMRRFKRKLCFTPHHVQWILGEDSPARPVQQLVYRVRRDRPLAVPERSDAEFVWAPNPAGLVARYGSISKTLSPASAAKLSAKVATSRRSAFCVVSSGAVVSYGETTHGRCRHYRIGEKGTVIGPVWTAPAVRGRGFATWALAQVINQLVQTGKHEIYIDTTESNHAMRKVIERCEFGEPLFGFPRHAGR